MNVLIAPALLVTVLIGAVPQKVTFQYSFKKDQTIRYRIESTSNMGMGNNKISMESSMHVDEVNPDGSAEITSKLDSGSAKVLGLKLKMPRGHDVHMTVSKYGKTIEMKGKNGNDQIVIQEFPDHAIAPGQSWDGTMHAVAGKSAIEVQAHFKFESLKSEAGRKLAHVLVTEEGESKGRGGMKVHATGYMDWDIAAGLPRHVHMEGTSEMGGMKGTFTTDQTPIEP